MKLMKIMFNQYNRSLLDIIIRYNRLYANQVKCTFDLVRDNRLYVDK